jgi:hypothetical protein
MEICTIHHLAEEDTGGQGWTYIRGELGHWDVSEKEQLANAHLIAVAPEMLEALKKVSKRIRSHGGEDGLTIELFDALTEIDNAIKKAEGGYNG